MADQPRDLSQAPDRRDPLARPFGMGFTPPTGNPVAMLPPPNEFVTAGQPLLIDRQVHTNTAVPAWTALLPAILARDPEATATAAHFVETARRENFSATQQSLSTEVRCPEAHPEGWDVASKRVVVPHTTPIPRARYLGGKAWLRGREILASGCLHDVGGRGRGFRITSQDGWQ